MKQQSSTEGQDDAKTMPSDVKSDQVQVEIVDKQDEAEEKKQEEEGVKDAWDAESSEEEPEEGTYFSLFFSIKKYQDRARETINMNNFLDR